MPLKKATRATRSTRTTKASSKASSDAVLDENIDATNVIDAKKKTAKSTAEPKKVLGERNAPNSDALDAAPASSKTQSSKSKASSKTTKSKKVQSATTDDSRATTPVPSSPTKRLPEDQIRAFLSNYDLETQARTSRLRASLEMSIQSATTRMRLAIERIPRAVRDLSLADFIDQYGANIHAFMSNAPVSHLAETQQEWDQIREERSPAKAKRSKTEEAKRTAGRTRKPTKGKTAAPSSPLPTKGKAPSLDSFKPDLPKEALKTPKPRMARPGEVITWQSINGSPICGIIGEDGVVRPVQFA
ncbi:Borealin-like, N-terminal [Kalmanozyma brasiliensis GHG001]|uniref:Borealin N-terminal domain-containing protein n=1 Tax=Kalmanozyma brasiliensis (strain GHG001) TaxID=1365824 RepID=V5F105_KALBG|nr:Borealin-like, N-terminal [Kalmanozyma brasiliensis GHG001]EST10008.1 Borealin-like, N-terminal [Kalmanozyma brasiliensis GHG001]